MTQYWRLHLNNAVVQPRYVDLTSSCPVKQSENRHFCPTFDIIGHRIWAALVPKVAKVHTQFWCMLMLDLGPRWLRPSPPYTPSWTSARASEYCCRPRINCLLHLVDSWFIGTQPFKLKVSLFSHMILIHNHHYHTGRSWHSSEEFQQVYPRSDEYMYPHLFSLL